MKKQVILILLVFCSNTLLFSQALHDTIYYNKNWEQCLVDEASYFRLVTIDTTRIGFQVRDYYISGKIQMEGFYRSINPDVKLGEFTYWYENGNKQTVCSFKSGVMDGIYKNWHSNGNLKLEKEYNLGKTEGTEKTWSEEGALIKSVEYKEGMMHGEFISYYDNGQPVRKDIYKKDKLLRGKCFTREGKDTTYFEYFVMPKFRGGVEGFKSFILEKLHYPEAAKENNEEGRVNVLFTIDKEGNVCGIRITKEDKTYFNQEAVRVLQESPKWLPGKRDGKSIDVSISLPIIFRMD